MDGKTMDGKNVDCVFNEQSMIVRIILKKYINVCFES